MAATNIFGRGMGQRRIKEILELYPNIMKSRESNKKKIDKIASIHGFKIKTAELFVNYIDYFLKFMHETKLEYKLKISKSSPKKKNTSHVLYDKKIIITGFRDKDLAAIIEEVGGQISSSISKNTFDVIVKNTSETTTKTEKAKKLKIPVMEKNQFVKKYL